MLGEFEGIRQQILQHLLQTFRVGDQTAGEVRVGVHLEGQPPVFRFVAEGTGHHFQQAGEEDFLRLDRNRSGLDLGKIENIADQVEQVGAGAVNGARKLDLLAASGCDPDCR